MTPLALLIAFSALTVAAIALVCWKRADDRATKFADSAAHWQWQALRLGRAIAHRRQEASDRARHARSCQLRQTHDLVASKTATLREELGL